MSVEVNLGLDRTPNGPYRTWTGESPDCDDDPGPATVRVAILALAQASLANMASFYEDLQAVNVLAGAPHQPRRFLPRIISHAAAARRTVSGLMLTPHATLDDQAYDAVLLPTLYDDGCLTDPGYGPIMSETERDWVCEQHRKGALLVTMCSGAYALAETGLLNGHEGAMHPLYAEVFQRRFPRVRVVRNRTLVVSGDRRELVTGGQSVYSADVSLFMIAHFQGAPMALEFAMLYGRTWTEAMHEETLAGATHDEYDDQIVNLARRFFLMHLGDAGLVSAAADLANLSVRTFSRRFRRETGVAPSEFIAALRLERASRLLARSRITIEEIAARVGYSDRSAFAKAFRERTGIPPAEYRKRFRVSAD